MKQAGTQNKDPHRVWRGDNSAPPQQPVQVNILLLKRGTASFEFKLDQWGGCRNAVIGHPRMNAPRKNLCCRSRGVDNYEAGLSVVQGFLNFFSFQGRQNDFILPSLDIGVTFIHGYCKEHEGDSRWLTACQPAKTYPPTYQPPLPHPACPALPALPCLHCPVCTAHPPTGHSTSPPACLSACQHHSSPPAPACPCLHACLLPARPPPARPLHDCKPHSSPPASCLPSCLIANPRQPTHLVAHGARYKTDIRPTRTCRCTQDNHGMIVRWTGVDRG